MAPHVSLRPCRPRCFCVVRRHLRAHVSTDPSPDAFTADFAARHIARDRRPGAGHRRLPAAGRQHHPRDVDRGDRRRPRGGRPGARRDRGGRAGVRAARPSADDQRGPRRAHRGRCSAPRRSRCSSCCCATGPDRARALSRPACSPSRPRSGRWPPTRCGRTPSPRSGSSAWRWAADRRRWWLVGLFGGLTLWGRLHAAVICAVARRRCGAGPGGFPGSPARVGAAAAASLALVSAWTRWMYGSWDPTSGYRAGDFGGKVAGYALDPLNYLGFVLSADRGLLWWCPLLLLLGPAAWRHRRELPDWSRWLAAGGASYLREPGGAQPVQRRGPLLRLPHQPRARRLASPRRSR